ncbi:MAG: biotin transporter BioY, partial [Oscillospiraceae bacterium]|nr:biotin transporter BioY [Oscillospiraceae bacterium]
MKNAKLRKMMMCAIFVALCSIFSQIILPIGVVPVNLTLIGVFVLSCTLDIKSAMVTVLVYIALGIVGIPVFAGFQSGFGVILGPTGGFIIGYIFTALIVSILIKFIHLKQNTMKNFKILHKKIIWIFQWN